MQKMSVDPNEYYSLSFQIYREVESIFQKWISKIFKTSVEASIRREYMLAFVQIGTVFVNATQLSPFLLKVFSYLDNIESHDKRIETYFQQNLSEMNDIINKSEFYFNTSYWVEFSNKVKMQPPENQFECGILIAKILKFAKIHQENQLENYFKNNLEELEKIKNHHAEYLCPSSIWKQLANKISIKPPENIFECEDLYKKVLKLHNQYFNL